MKRFGGITVLLSLLAFTAWAQPSARITTTHAVQGDQNATMTLHILCDDEVQYTLTPSQLSLTDNGEPVEEFTITESPSPTARKVFSTALVLDASGSMSGAPNAAAKAAATDFVNFMDGQLDEAAVLFFTSTVKVFQSMTTIKPMLAAAVSALPASGATAVWDAAYAGVEHVAANGVNPRRSVLVLTDGGDNSSTRTPAQVIALAQFHDIRVFTIGLGSNINVGDLQLIATLTGAQYFQTPTANDLQSIFMQIANFMGRGFDEHTVAFRSPVPAASEHEIVARVIVCDEEVEASHTEQAIIVSGIRNTAAPAAPVTLLLGANAPNPFAAGSTTVIPYQVLGTVPRNIRLQLFDLLGRHVATLVDGEVQAGSHTVSFAPSNLAKGVYLYRLSSGSSVTSRFMLLQ
jgi:hypothetical protein